MRWSPEGSVSHRSRSRRLLIRTTPLKLDVDHVWRGEYDSAGCMWQITYITVWSTRDNTDHGSTDHNHCNVRNPNTIPRARICGVGFAILSWSMYRQCLHLNFNYYIHKLLVVLPRFPFFSLAVNPCTINSWLGHGILGIHSKRIRRMNTDIRASKKIDWKSSSCLENVYASK